MLTEAQRLPVNTICPQRSKLSGAIRLLNAGWPVLRLCVASAQTETRIWSKHLGANATDFGYALTVDQSGHVILAGAAESSLGATSLGLPDVLAGKFDASGNQLWLRQRGTTDHDYGLAGGTDPVGNVFVVGITGGNLDGNSNIGKWDWFVMKFDAAGEWQWARQEGTSLDDEAHGVACDTNGNVYVTGFVHGSLHGQTQVGVLDAFLTKCNSAGARLWTVQFGSTENDSGEAIALDAAGNVYLAGETSASLLGKIPTPATWTCSCSNTIPAAACCGRSSWALPPWTSRKGWRIFSLSSTARPTCPRQRP